MWLIVSFGLIFGSYTSQVSSLSLINHISSAHSVSVDHHHHSNHHGTHSHGTKKKTKASHDHQSELASINAQVVVLPTQETFFVIKTHANMRVVFYPSYVPAESKFSTNIFRPPIS